MKKLLAPLSLAALILQPGGIGRAQDAPKDTSVTIRSTVQEVVLEVVVRDARGRVVKNLKPGDLEVFENGVRQEVRSFKLVQGRDVVTKGKALPRVNLPRRRWPRIR